MSLIYPLKIVVSGDRYYTDKNNIAFILKQFTVLTFQQWLANYISPNKSIPLIQKLSDLHIIQGGCKGADILAKSIAQEWGCQISTFAISREHWREYGKKAGPIRNKQMLDENPHIVLCFHNNLQHSKGTKNMFKQALKTNIPIIHIYGDVTKGHYMLYNYLDK